MTYSIYALFLLTSLKVLSCEKAFDEKSVGPLLMKNIVHYYSSEKGFIEVEGAYDTAIRDVKYTLYKGGLKIKDTKNVDHRRFKKIGLNDISFKEYMDIFDLINKNYQYRNR